MVRHFISCYIINLKGSHWALLLSLWFNISSYAQLKIDHSFSFRSIQKKYSLYIPSGYQNGQAAVLALHPLNTARWNSTSWRDTLIAFAEANKVLLICPDGGPDGRIDDESDTAFTSVLLDSVQLWYPYHRDKLIAMGFSWGGRTVYSYGLSRPDLIYGLIPIGAAIDGMAQMQGKEQGANFRNVFIVHGANDDPANRYQPAKQFFARTSACVFDTLMAGIGHTIDFPDRNKILTRAYQKVWSHDCLTSSVSETNPSSGTMKIFYTQGELRFTCEKCPGSLHFMISDLSGQFITNGRWQKDQGGYELDLNPGVYVVSIPELLESYKVVVFEF